jgi:organic radical activating enzyme
MNETLTKHIFINIPMPSKSEKQKRFFGLIKEVQTGKVSPKKVGSKVVKAARSMNPKSVNDFLEGKLTKNRLNEIVDYLRDLRYDTTGTSFSGKGPAEPMNLEEEEEISSENPVAKTFTQNGNFEQYIQKFSGLELKPKEIESITNYFDKSKPTNQSDFEQQNGQGPKKILFVRYESTDDFNNSTIHVIKKLREGNDLVFTAFQKNSSQSDDNTDGNSVENEIEVYKSVTFRDEIEGGEVLANLLRKLEV